jgi:hypothetical protein
MGRPRAVIRPLTNRHPSTRHAIVTAAILRTMREAAATPPVAEPPRAPKPYRRTRRERLADLRESMPGAPKSLLRQVERDVRRLQRWRERNGATEVSG